MPFCIHSKLTKRYRMKERKKAICVHVCDIREIKERMPYSHSHRVACVAAAGKTGDSDLLTFDFRSSRRGGRHHVRLEYQLPIRSENGITSRSYSVISAESYLLTVVLG